MKSAELTLKERGSHLFSELLLLQRLFQPLSEEDAEWPGTGDKTRDLAFFAGIRTLVDDLTEHARILTTVPFPLSEWQPGDDSDDERWRALTEMERREVVAMITAYENLIAWSEALASSLQSNNGKQERRTAVDYLKAERSRVGRFRQELEFLERRPETDDDEQRLDG